MSEELQKFDEQIAIENERRANQKHLNGLHEAHGNVLFGNLERQLERQREWVKKELKDRPSRDGRGTIYDEVKR